MGDPTPEERVNLVLGPHKEVTVQVIAKVVQAIREAETAAYKRGWKAAQALGSLFANDDQAVDV